MSEQERSLRRALEIRQGLLNDCVEGAGKLPASVEDAFSYLMNHIHEQNRRILQLEMGMERLGPIVGTRPPIPKDELERWDLFKRLEREKRGEPR